MEAYADIDSARSKKATDTDWAVSKIDKRSTIGYCMLVGRNLVSWGKKTVTAGSSSKAKIQAMAHGFYALLWVKILLKDSHFKQSGPYISALNCQNRMYE